MHVKKRRPGTPRRRKNIQTVLLSDTRYRAKKKGIECTLTREDIQRLFRNAGGRCSLTGIEFNRDFKGHDNQFHFKPYRPSLDRIDATKGYTPDNVRLVLSAMNTALGEFGEDVFDELARAYLEQKGYRVDPPVLHPNQRRGRRAA